MSAVHIIDINEAESKDLDVVQSGQRRMLYVNLDMS